MGFWTKRRSLRTRFIVLMAFVLPVTVALSYVIGGSGEAIADVVVNVVIFAAMGLILRRLADRLR